MNIHPLWFFCIILRLSMSYVSTKLNNKASFILLIISLGFLYQSTFGSNNEIQVRKVFWHETRSIHSFLYFCAFISMYYKLKYKNYELSGLFLLCDVIVSVSFRVIYDL